MWSLLSSLLILIIASRCSIAARGRGGSRSSRDQCDIALRGLKDDLDSLSDAIDALTAMTTASTASVNCVINALAYGAGDTNTVGFIKVNDTQCLASVQTSKNNYRGVNIMTVDPLTCIASNWIQFDTFANATGATDLVTHISYQRDGAVLVGVTFDEYCPYLCSALAFLKVIGIDVIDVGCRGKFAFVIQKGYPEKTIMVKGPEGGKSVELKVQLSGGRGDNIILKRLLI